jgi:hypothetical protein
MEIKRQPLPGERRRKRQTRRTDGLRRTAQERRIGLALGAEGGEATGGGVWAAGASELARL